MHRSKAKFHRKWCRITRPSHSEGSRRRFWKSRAGILIQSTSITSSISWLATQTLSNNLTPIILLSARKRFQFMIFQTIFWTRVLSFKIKVRMVTPRKISGILIKHRARSNLMKFVVFRLKVETMRPTLSNPIDPQIWKTVLQSCDQNLKIK